MGGDQEPIRDVLRMLNPAVSHKAAEQPEIDEIYAPPQHADALDPNRSLVVGGRGVGKSFWAAVLSNPATRKAAAVAYPKLGLENLDVQLGFHEGALGTGELAPSPAALKAALKITDDSTLIWRSVLLKAVAPNLGPTKLIERVKWIEEDTEAAEDILVDADKRYSQDKKFLLIVFDALDVLANDWETIRILTQGLARLTLETTSRRAIRMKLFMRHDQFLDMRRTPFADFSKLRTAAVELVWSPTDLYGLLFTRLWRSKKSHFLLSQLGNESNLNMSGDDLPRTLKTNDKAQDALFSSFAGEFMGANRKRGRTYTWLPKHLADAHGEASLRSFLIALKVAAERARDGQELAIDHQGINAGVLEASETRREELKEDHPWVEDALEALSGLIVPCEESEIIGRWRMANTRDKIDTLVDPRRPTTPIQLDLFDSDSPEHALLNALIKLGVIEKRDRGRVNFPDIFRIAAKMKRKGGVVPRRKR